MYFQRVPFSRILSLKSHTFIWVCLNPPFCYMVRKWECRKQTFQSLFGVWDRCPLSMNTVNRGLEGQGMLIGVVVGEVEWTVPGRDSKFSTGQGWCFASWPDYFFLIQSALIRCFIFTMFCACLECHENGVGWVEQLEVNYFHSVSWEYTFPPCLPHPLKTHNQ